jgi:ABC-type multidrug transport system fused ATPase/permease subunit
MRPSNQLKGGTRVGICGRTGAGKSTIMVALFRICSVSSGSILIDGVDTRTVPLPVLRLYKYVSFCASALQLFCLHLFTV